MRIHSLQAAGDLTHLVVDENWLPSFIAGTRIARMEQVAGRPLAASPLCTNTSDLDDGGEPCPRSSAGTARSGCHSAV
ncbi:MAG TPA: hypothetical protein VKB17_09830 [Thermoleophilaceae bacterium]|nr:hypothetical protein [Thermoleophilaceae bacterium]